MKSCRTDHEPARSLGAATRPRVMASVLVMLLCPLLALAQQDFNADGSDDAALLSPVDPPLQATDADGEPIDLVQRLDLYDPSTSTSLLTTYSDAPTRTVSVASIDDGDGDGLREAVLGRPFDGANGAFAGGLTIVSSSTGEDLAQLYGSPYSYFGRAVADVGDLDGDGYTDLAVSGFVYDSSLLRTASVVVLSGWNLEPLARFASLDPDSEFGADVLAVGDLDADGVPDLAISDPAFAAGADGPTGAVFLFSGVLPAQPDTPVLADQAIDVLANGDAQATEFGRALLAGVNHDGAPTAVVVSETDGTAADASYRFTRLDLLTGTTIAAETLGVGRLGALIDGDLDGDLGVSASDLTQAVTTMSSTDSVSASGEATVTEQLADADADGQLTDADLGVVVVQQGTVSPVRDWLASSVVSQGKLSALHVLAGAVFLKPQTHGDLATPTIPGCVIAIPGTFWYCGNIGPYDTRFGDDDSLSSDADGPADDAVGDDGQQDGDDDGDDGSDDCPKLTIVGDVDHDGEITAADDRRPFGDQFPAWFTPEERSDPHFAYEDLPGPNWNPGVIVVVNDDDDNGDGLPDRLTPSPERHNFGRLIQAGDVGAFQNPGNTWADDDDLVRIVVRVPDEWKQMPGQRWRIKDLPGGLRVFTDKSRRRLVGGIGDPPNGGWIWVETPSPDDVPDPTEVPVYAIPDVIWVEATSPSARLGDLQLTFEVELQAPCDMETDDPAYPRKEDELGLTAVRVEMHDLFYWKPKVPARLGEILTDDDLNPSVNQANLDASPSDLPSGIPDSRVTGAVADGAALTLLRSKPLFRRPPESTGGPGQGSSRSPNGEWESVVIPGMEIELVARNDIETTAPESVGTVYPIQRPAEYADSDDQPWRALLQSGGAASNALPLVPARLDAAGKPQGYNETTIPFEHGLAYYLPPEAYPHRDASDSLNHGDRGLNDEETCPIDIRLFIGGPDPVGASSFKLRRAPIVFVHGLFGASDQRFGGDDRHYWSQWHYNEWPLSPPVLESGPPDGFTLPGRDPSRTGSPLPTRLYFVNYESTNMLGPGDQLPLIAAWSVAILREYRTGLSVPARHVLEAGREVYGFEPDDPNSTVSERYAIARMDYVGHSMGGLIIRAYLSSLGSHAYAPAIPPDRFWRLLDEGPPTQWPALQFPRQFRNPLSSDLSARMNVTHDDLVPHGGGDAFHRGNWWAGAARRVITIGTPHRGSPLGELSSSLFEPAGGPGRLPTLLTHPEGRRLIVEIRGEEEGPALLATLDAMYRANQPPTAMADLGTRSRFSTLLARIDVYPSTSSRRYARVHAIASKIDDPSAGNPPSPAGVNRLLEALDSVPDRISPIDGIVDPGTVPTMDVTALSLEVAGAIASLADQRISTVLKAGPGAARAAKKAIADISSLTDEHSDGVVTIGSQLNARHLAPSDPNFTSGSLFKGAWHSGNDLASLGGVWASQTFSTEIATRGSGARENGVYYLLGGFASRLRPMRLGMEVE